MKFLLSLSFILIGFIAVFGQSKKTKQIKFLPVYKTVVPTTGKLKTAAVYTYAPKTDAEKYDRKLRKEVKSYDIALKLKGIPEAKKIKLFKKGIPEKAKYKIGKSHNKVSPVWVKLNEGLLVFGTIDEKRKLHLAEKPFLIKKDKLYNEKITGFTEEGYLVVENGGLKTYKKIVLNKDLQVVKPQFIKEIDPPAISKKSKKYFVAPPFEAFSGTNRKLLYKTNKFLEKEGLILVKRRKWTKEQKKNPNKIAYYNYADANGVLLFEWQRMETTKFYGQYEHGKVAFVKDGQWHIFDNKGKSLFQFPEGTVNATNFNEGLALFETSNGVAVINKEGKVLKDFKSGFSLPFNKVRNGFNGDGYAVVKSSANNLEYLISKELEVVQESESKEITFHDEHIFRLLQKKVITKTAKNKKHIADGIPSDAVLERYLKGVTVYSGYTPGSGGYVPKDQRRKYFFKNTGKKTVTVKVVFTTNTYSYGTSQKETVTYKVKVIPGKVSVLSPKQGTLYKLRNKHKYNNHWKVTYTLL